MNNASDPPSPAPPVTGTNSGAAPEDGAARELRKGPLSFLSGALTSGLLAWLALALSSRVVAYYAAHPPHYSSRVAQSIGTAVKTLVVGMTFLATFTFAFVAIGLFLTFFRSLWPAASGPSTRGQGRPS
ncbi:MAG: DUF3082 domain-containing protein [Cyanobacteriota bacterium]|jgi:hypothetical protein